jgi:hypothetical protein
VQAQKKSLPSCKLAFELYHRITNPNIKKTSENIWLLCLLFYFVSFLLLLFVFIPLWIVIFPTLLIIPHLFTRVLFVNKNAKKKSILFLLSFLQTNNNKNTIRNITINNKNIITLKSYQNQKPTSEKCTISTIFPFKGFVICLEFKFIRIL